MFFATNNRWRYLRVRTVGRIIEQPEAHARIEQTIDGRVDVGIGNHRLAISLQQGCTHHVVTTFDVKTSLECERCSSLLGFHIMVRLDQQPWGSTVAHDVAAKAPFVAQHLGQ